MPRFDIDSLIQAKEAAIEAKEKELELLKAELRGMEAVADAMASHSGPSLGITRPAAQKMAPDHDASSERPTQKGRQPGAISHQWRDTLAMLWMNYPYPQGFTEYNAATAAQAAGLPHVKPKDALERMTAYISHGYVERLPDGKWRVTNLTAKKYGFSTKGAPTGELTGASRVETEEAP
jgi:hypothetical protein